MYLRMQILSGIPSLFNRTKKNPHNHLSPPEQELNPPFVFFMQELF